MTTVTAALAGFRTARNTGQRLTLSFALSIVAHVVVIAMFAGLLKPMLTPAPRLAGLAVPIEVALVAVRPIAFTAPPESPATATELPSAPQPTGPAASVQPMLPPSPSRPEVRVPKHPFGVSVQSDAEAEAVGADLPPPPGDTSVGAIADSERLGQIGRASCRERVFGYV